MYLGEEPRTIPAGQTPLIERLEIGIAATVREIDELRAENQRLRAQLATCQCQDVA